MAKQTAEKHPLFARFVRNRVMSTLVREHGMTWSEAAAQVEKLDEETISHGTTHVGLETPPQGPRGLGGKFFDWVRNLDPAKIAALVQFLVTVLGFFATPSPAAAQAPGEGNQEES